MTAGTRIEKRVSEIQLKDWCVAQIDATVKREKLKLSAIEAKSGLSKSAVSLILRGKRSPSDTTLEALAKAVGLDYQELRSDAGEEIRYAAVIAKGTPFLAIGPFVDNLILAWATRDFVAGLNQLSAAAKEGAVETRPWSDLLSEITKPQGPLFCLGNEAQARHLALGGAPGLVKLNHWRIRLEPCFCIIGQKPSEDREPTSYSDLQRANPDLSGGEILQRILRNLGGKVIVVEAGSDIEANARLLLGLAKDLRVIEEEEWKGFFDWPNVGQDEVVIATEANTSTAMAGLAKGYRDHYLVAGGHPQLIAASSCRRAPRLEVVVKDTELWQALPSIPPKWHAPINKVFACRSRLEEAGLDLTQVSGLFDEILGRLSPLAQERIEELVGWITAEYEPFGGAGAPLDPQQYVQLLEESHVERLENVNLGFVSAAEDG